MKTTALLLIDAQYDFCQPQGALYVPGAEQDVIRIADLIRRHTGQIDQIVVTLDTHHVLNIAHPGFWEDREGHSPDPFTLITAADVDAGRWVPRYEADYAKEYVRTLEAQGEFQHFIWPEHCLIGTRGAALDDTIVEAVRDWVHQTGRDYEAVIKGVHPFAEHFGIFRAQVPVPGAPKTKLNTSLITLLERYDQVLVAGEARSHCVATSMKQILRYAPALVPKVVVLTDCMSDVTGLGHLADPIYAEAQEKGVTFTTSTALNF
ncbi:nicotinamidase [Telluribacter sp.]|jgi:nicotinamidase-related amidase|uniref:nicotinamidase n=1 Tax=Telluribacter sp. TaxID=1978767 RepID=UPI002E1102CD|nr:nicotinamidase [Telluribacter sp.]